MSTEQLCLITEGKLRNYLNQQVKDKSQVDDLLQGIFLKMGKHINSLQQVEKADRWLWQITRNTLMDHCRQEQKIRKLKSKIPQTPNPAPVKEEVLRDRTAELANFIPEAISLLPDKYREAIYLTEIEGLSQKELAERLGISYSGAKSRVQRGREKLKEIILACCDVAADKYGNIIEYKSRQQTCEEC